MTATRRRAWGKYDSMNKDGPNGSPYEMLAKHDQSETKCDTWRATNSVTLLYGLTAAGRPDRKSLVQRLMKN
jgi:hypothetical protein